MLKRIFLFIKTKKFMLKKLNENMQYFSPGQYLLDDSLKYAFKDDVDSYKIAREMFEKSYIRPIYRFYLRCIKHIMFKKNICIVKEQQTNPQYLGTIYFIGTNNDSKAKIFDLINKKVLTIYFSDEDFGEVIENYQFFKCFLPPPKILSTDPKKLLIVEELIHTYPNHKWSNNDTEYVINDLFNRYIEYFTICKMQGRYYLEEPKAKLSKICNKVASSFLKSTTDMDLLNFKLPLLKLHGDLWAPNILFNPKEKENMKFIDFEYSDNYVFYYDIFWFIHDQEINQNNDFYIQKYFNGDFDGYFKQMFSIFDLEYEKKYKWDYFNIYFINLIEKRWNTFSKKQMKMKLNNYQSLRKKYNVEMKFS